MKQIVDKLNKIAKKIDESVEIPQTDLIIDSLDAITKAYGGTPNDSNLIVDKLEDIYNNIGSAPSGNIEITENGENINVAPYATATVNVSGGGGLDLKKTTLTLLNTSETAGDPSTFFTEAINYFVYVEIDGKQAPRTAYNSQFSMLDIADYLKSLSIAPNETLIIELYYCYLLSARAMSALGCASNIGTSLVNMTWDSDYNEYLINDITMDSAITIDVKDIPK